jgi:predicted RNA-binding protein with PIN domain
LTAARPSRWLVDGMNVVGSRPTGWWRDREAAMRRLLEELGRFAAATGEDVTVVFDGRPFEVEPPARVTVDFASRRGPDAADDEIARRVAADPERGSLRVVTSDRALGVRVREAGGETISAGSFLRRLEREG